MHSLVNACQQIANGTPLVPKQIPPQMQHSGASTPALILVPPYANVAAGQTHVAGLRIAQSTGYSEVGLGGSGSSWRSGKFPQASFHAGSEFSNGSTAAQMQPVRVESSVGHEAQASGLPQDWENHRVSVASPVGGGGVALDLASLGSSGSSQQPVGGAHEREFTVPVGLGEGGGSAGLSEGEDNNAGSFDSPNGRDVRRRLAAATTAMSNMGEGFGHKSSSTVRRSFEGDVRTEIESNGSHHGEKNGMRSVVPNAASFDSGVQPLAVEHANEMVNSDNEEEERRGEEVSGVPVSSSSEQCLMPPPGLLW